MKNLQKMVMISELLGTIAKNWQKFLWKLTTGHRMEVNSMKYILCDDLGVHSRIIQEKPLLTVNAPSWD